MAGYQGWKNYTTWGMALVFDNDRDIYEYFRAQIQELADEAADSEQVGEGIWTEKEFVKFSLSDDMKQFVEDWVEQAQENIKEGPGASLVSQLLSSAMDEVDWHEIAEHYMEE